jgi:hypothetical protein
MLPTLERTNRISAALKKEMLKPKRSSFTQQKTAEIVKSGLYFARA